ncbi:MAG: hypothetical protein MUF51_10520 [Vicinamibacteria bacterium]|jgi:Tol biopolymer transport system component|nr:hypothetical protein [Vicinamibacteria bacterium]
MRRRTLGCLLILPLCLLVTLALMIHFSSAPDPAPAGAVGKLAYVSDRDGTDAIYWRVITETWDRKLTHYQEAAREPAFSPDGWCVAFALEGRIGIADIVTGDARIVTLGVDWLDSAPAWRADGRALAVCARKRGGKSDLHVLLLDRDTRVDKEARVIVTQTEGMDETSPAFLPDGRALVFAREDAIFRVEIGSGKVARLTGGLRKCRQPRVTRDGRVVFLWSEAKLYGIDAMDADGTHASNLLQGSIFDRTLALSPDGRFATTTFTYDLGFHPLRLLRLRQTEEVHLIDLARRRRSILARSLRYAYHSPDWGR